MAIVRSLALDCSPRVTFAAFTDKAEVLKWWGDPTVYRTIEWEAEPRPGGRWHALFEAPGGQRFGAGGAYRLAVEPSLLEWTWISDWAPEDTKQIKMRIEPASNGSTLILTSAGHRDEKERAEDERGWDQILGWLSKHYNENIVE